MRYRLLGALEVVDQESVITPTAPKQRTVLAMLLINHDRDVSRTTLIDEIWPVNPPTTAMMTLNTYVYQLRKVLAQGPSGDADLVRTKPGGYQVSLDAQCLDLSLFESMVAAGRRDFAAGRFAEANCSLRAALQLCTGPVLSGLDKGPRLAAVAARVEEDALDALALRIEIDLNLGRHRELIGELSALVTRYPANEDFHAKLMVALYRSDRRLVALETYQRLRRSLNHNYGVDPSLRLRRLHQDILADAPRLFAPTDAPVAAS